MTRHGRDCPERCSICLAAPVRHVDIVNGAVLIDGQPTGRTVDPERERAFYDRRNRRRE